MRRRQLQCCQRSTGRDDESGRAAGVALSRWYVTCIADAGTQSVSIGAAAATGAPSFPVCSFGSMASRYAVSAEPSKISKLLSGPTMPRDVLWMESSLSC